MKFFTVLIGAVLLSGCGLASHIRPESVEFDSLIGCYKSYDSTGYGSTFELELKSDGSYRSTVHQHLSPKMVYSGKWQLAENRIIFIETLRDTNSEPFFNSLLIGRRWPYKILARNLEEIKKGQSEGLNAFYFHRCNV